jgi:class 3 adenylate cyclase
VLFVDIAGYTALSDRLDPELVRALQNEYFQVVDQVVRQWHGVVEKHIGDGVMAVFGIPRADEHDAYRAVRAGLGLQEALAGRRFRGGRTIRARVGVATGEEVVDLLAGGRNSGRSMVSGRVVTTATQIQRYATGGAVAVSQATRDLTTSSVPYQELPPVVLAGRREPVRIWRTCRPRPADTRRSPYVRPMMQTVATS